MVRIEDLTVVVLNVLNQRKEIPLLCMNKFFPSSAYHGKAINLEEGVR